MIYILLLSLGEDLSLLYLPSSLSDEELLLKQGLVIDMHAEIL